MFEQLPPLAERAIDQQFVRAKKQIENHVGGRCLMGEALDSAGGRMYALEQRIEVVAIDERKGRRAARAVGLTVTGTLGLLARGKTLGILPAARPIIERMQANGVWFDEELVRRVLAQLGE